jgi:hypothetical protein
MIATPSAPTAANCNAPATTIRTAFLVIAFSQGLYGLQVRGSARISSVDFVVDPPYLGHCFHGCQVDDVIPQQLRCVEPDKP